MHYDKIDSVWMRITAHRGQPILYDRFHYSYGSKRIHGYGFRASAEKETIEKRCACCGTWLGDADEIYLRRTDHDADCFCALCYPGISLGQSREEVLLRRVKSLRPLPPRDFFSMVREMRKLQRARDGHLLFDAAKLHTNETVIDAYIECYCPGFAAERPDEHYSTDPPSPEAIPL